MPAMTRRQCFLLQLLLPLLIAATSSGGAELNMVPDPILAGIQAQAEVATKGLGGDLVWPGLLRKLDRLDPTYKE